MTAKPATFSFDDFSAVYRLYARLVADALSVRTCMYLIHWMRNERVKYDPEVRRHVLRGFDLLTNLTRYVAWQNLTESRKYNAIIRETFGSLKKKIREMQLSFALNRASPDRLRGQLARLLVVYLHADYHKISTRVRVTPVPDGYSHGGSGGTAAILRWYGYRLLGAGVPLAFIGILIGNKKLLVESGFNNADLVLAIFAWTVFALDLFFDIGLLPRITDALGNFSSIRRR
jgi:hypothetical protein